MYEVEIMTSDCPRVLCDPPPGGFMTTVNTLTGEARCHGCDTQWEYGQHELLEILNNLED